MRAGFGSSFSVEKSHAMQLQLSKRVVCEDCLPEAIRYVAGVDVAYSGENSIGAVAVLDFASLSTVEFEVARVKTSYPYVPTLLSFREISPAVSAIQKLEVRPDVFLIDGQGIAHPYRLGFASHLGLMINKPTIGVAKSLLCGEVQPFNGQRLAPIIDHGETIGMAVITVPGKKPLYVSIGHQVSLERSVQVVAHCVRGYRIPEPIGRAHMAANAEKKLQTK